MLCTLLDLNTPICVNTTIIQNFKNLRIFVAICLHESLNLTPFCMEFVIAVNPSEGLKQNVFKSAKTILNHKKLLNLTTKKKSFESKMPALFALLGARNEELKSI